MKIGQEDVLNRTECFHNTLARTTGRRREPTLNAFPRDDCFVENELLEAGLGNTWIHRAEHAPVPSPRSSRRGIRVSRPI